jgi:pyruvate/2-oxoglutarate dehydrogenase complex dihydrolipoamide dehydrogenase (E3) component
MADTERYDAVVLGAGPGGRGAAKRLVKAGRSVAMVEQELVGGECPFWACIPTKWLLRPIEAADDVQHVPGLGAPERRMAEILEYRDYMNSGLDDTSHAKSFSDMGIDIVRGKGRISGPGTVQVGDRTLSAGDIIVATGTTAAIPPIDGIESVDAWTNREATTLTEVPASAVVLGGGPVGIELGQMLSRYGAKVTLVESAERLLSREDPEVGELIREHFLAEGIDVRVGVRAEAVERDGDAVKVRLEGGDTVRAERLVVAVGRKPRLEGIGLEEAGVTTGDKGIEVDDHCRAAAGIWAVGDVTGVAPFTHVAAYQSGVATDAILGRADRPADYRAIPRVVFCAPEVAAVGLTAAQAEEQGLRVASATVEMSEVDRTETYGKGLSGKMGVLADAGRGVLVGAWAVGPLASEWIHALVIAIKAEVPVTVLRDTVMQFPTFSEAIGTAVGRLEL